MRSMTGCGKGTAADGTWEVTVELKSVNRRFLDIGCRIPRTLGFLEEPMRRMLAEHLKRGHVDVYLTVRSTGGSSQVVRVDEALAAAYLKAAEQLRDLGAGKNLRVAELMQLEGVIQREEAELDEEAVTALFRQACGQALEQLTQMRDAEGRMLRADLAEHLDRVAALRGEVAERAPQVVENYRERLSARLEKLPVEPVEPQRLAQEVAIFADRCALDEELSRLVSHIDQFRRFLDAEGETGKKLDFLTQEMNREANTIGSKANDSAITSRMLDLKAEIEKIREQVQNIE